MNTSDASNGDLALHGNFRGAEVVYVLAENPAHSQPAILARSLFDAVHGVGGRFQFTAGQVMTAPLQRQGFGLPSNFCLLLGHHPGSVRCSGLGFNGQISAKASGGASKF
jgi:hypothetical protein